MPRTSAVIVGVTTSLLLAACSAQSGDGATGAPTDSSGPVVTAAPGEWAAAHGDLAPGTIVTVVGTGELVLELEGVGGPASEARLEKPPVGLAFDAGGNLYIAERFNNQVLKVDPTGILTMFAGKLSDGRPSAGFSGDGGPATEAELESVSDVAVGPDGNLYASDSGNHRVRMVDRDGIITTVAGNGERGFSGDGGPATRSSLNNPVGLAVDGEGNLYIWDAGNLRVRMVDAEGDIATVAGTGESGLSPDGTPATEAHLGHPSDHMPIGLAFDDAGRLHITDLGNNRVWMIDAEGRVRTVAGNGDAAFSGDGGPATEAGVNQPLDIAFGSDGSLYISTHTHSTEGHRVRMVDANGVITTIAGTETVGYSGDGGPADMAQLNIPSGIAFGPDGNLYIAGGGNRVIRMVVR